MNLILGSKSQLSVTFEDFAAVDVGTGTTVYVTITLRFSCPLYIVTRDLNT